MIDRKANWMIDDGARARRSSSVWDAHAAEKRCFNGITIRQCGWGKDSITPRRLYTSPFLIPLGGRGIVAPLMHERDGDLVIAVSGGR